MYLTTHDQTNKRAHNICGPSCREPYDTKESGVHKDLTGRSMGKATETIHAILNQPEVQLACVTVSNLIAQTPRSAGEDLRLHL